MKKQETGYFSSLDGLRLFYRAWENDSPHAILLIHGLGEHSGRHTELIEALGDLPFSFYIHDLRGHGQSEGERMYVDRFEDFVEDIYTFRKFILDHRQGQGKRFILHGQSLGGLIATRAALRHQADWDRLVLLSPFFGLPLGDRMAGFTASILSRVAPRRMWQNPFQPVFLTHDVDRLQAYQRDRLIQRQITSRLAAEIVEAAKQTLSEASGISLPLLLLAAGDDHIVSTRKAKEFFSKVASSDKKMQVYDGFYHELIHEWDRVKPIQDLKDYLASIS
ncbi:MAG: lysophospholipase [Candidatus Omnitrophica bacterium]|nr:lysophospholipase [Candidatus Omnitrophota bacterium]